MPEAPQWTKIYGTVRVVTARVLVSVLRVGCRHRGHSSREAEVQDDGLQSGVVDGLCSSESGELKPDDECRLEGKVPGNVVENDREGQALKEVEETEDDPVGEPLDIVVGGGGLDGLEGEISWESPADEIGDGLRGSVEGMENDDEDDEANGGVDLGDLSSLLKVVESGELCELLVELVDVDGGLVLRLDEDRVLLNFLCGGHVDSRVER